MCLAILHPANDTRITFFQKTDRCNYLEYSGDAVLVIYVYVMGFKKQI